MKHIPVFILSIFILFSSCSNKSNSLDTSGIITNQLKLFLDNDNSGAQYIFVRHAEKKTGDNPSLTTEGALRAERLAQMLTLINIDYVYSTDYKRTIETAAPTSAAKNLETKFYNPRNLDDFANKLLTKHSNSTVLIVGHSNSTPYLVNKVLKKDRLKAFDESDYDNLMIIKKSKKGALALTKLQFNTNGLRD